jgi:hypothetical protein
MTQMRQANGLAGLGLTDRQHAPIGRFDAGATLRDHDVELRLQNELELPA